MKKTKLCRVNNNTYITGIKKFIVSFLLIITLIVCSIHPVKADLLDQTVSDEERIMITYYDKNHRQVGEPDISHTLDGLTETPYIAAVTIFTMTKGDDAEKIVEAEWQIGDTTYLFSENNRFKNNPKKDNVIYVDPAGYAGQNAGAMESSMKVALRSEPDFRALPTIKGLKLSSMIRFIIRGAMNGIANWVVDTLGITFDEMLFEFTQFGPDTGYIENIFTLNTEDGTHNYFQDFLLVFTGIGSFLSFMIFVAILFLSFGGPATGLEEHPAGLILRWLIAFFLVFRGREVLDYIFDITNSFLTAFGSFITGDGYQVNIVSNLFQYSDIPIILNIILVVLILFEYLKLMLEIIERYIVTMVMYIAAPLAFATFTSKNSSKVCVQFLKMLINQMVVYVLTLWMANVICMVIANVPYAMETKPVFSQIVHYFFILGLIKCACKFDQYLKDMGLTVARSAANLGGAVMATAGMAYGAMRAMSSAGRVASSAYRSANKPTSDVSSKLGSKVVTDPNSRAATKPDAKLAGDAAKKQVTSDAKLMRGLGITQDDIKNNRVGNFMYDKSTGTGSFERYDKNGNTSTVKYSRSEKDGYDIKGVSKKDAEQVFFSSDSVNRDTPMYSFQGFEGSENGNNFAYAANIDALDKDNVSAIFDGMSSREFTNDDMQNVKTFVYNSGAGGHMEWNDGAETHKVSFDFNHNELGNKHIPLVGGGEITTYQTISASDILKSMEPGSVGNQSIFESKVGLDAVPSLGGELKTDAQIDLNMWNDSGYSRLACEDPKFKVYISDPSKCTASHGRAVNLDGHIVMVSTDEPKRRI